MGAYPWEICYLGESVNSMPCRGTIFLYGLEYYSITLFLSVLSVLFIVNRMLRNQYGFTGTKEDLIIMACVCSVALLFF
jgi:hypothetical protein